MAGDEPTMSEEELDARAAAGLIFPLAAKIAVVALLVVGIVVFAWLQLSRRSRMEALKEKVAAELLEAKKGAGGSLGETVLAETAATAEDVASVAGRQADKNADVGRRVVFTNGRRIVRHSNGLVEVPRVFSCDGAGVKPFWVYSENPDDEAAKEKKAREEWESLCREAKAK